MSDKKPLVWTFPEPINKQRNNPLQHNQVKSAEKHNYLTTCQNHLITCVSDIASNNDLEQEGGNIHNPFELAKTVAASIQKGETKRLKVLWIEASECFAEVISLLDGQDPDIIYWLTQIVDLKFFGSIMAEQGENAYQNIIDTVNSGEEYILAVSGAIPLAEDGCCAIVASYEGRLITVAEAVRFAAAKAKEVLCIGTCACYGGPTAARPNITEAIGVGEFLQREVINAPGCPCNPIWAMGIFAYLAGFGHPPTDEDGRPLAFYGATIHQHCPRKSYFDKQEYAKKFGDPECLIKLGCRGPRTKTLCPYTRWNNSLNWPIGDNTTCIGCANKGFPDEMEPFVKFDDEED